VSEKQKAITATSIAIWKKAVAAAKTAFPHPVDTGNVMAGVGLHSFEVALETELERGEEVAHSLLSALLADIANALSRDGRKVEITVDWREPNPERRV
jgi:hypothetical protein